MPTTFPFLTRLPLFTLMLSLSACRSESAWLDDADLTPVARMVEALQLDRPDAHITLSDITGKGPRPDEYDFDVPDTIRIWRRSEGGSASCEGPVDELDFETYVARVLAHEWYMSWNGESHKAGAIAIRSYAAWWVNAGGKYDCADVCDTTYTQAYGDDSHVNADIAVEATLGQFIVDDGSVVFAEYSSENSDPTEYGVSDPHCTGTERYGHGRGMCQFGTMRWADYDSKSPEWMVEHYYPGASVTGSFAGVLEGGGEDIEMPAESTLTVEASFQNTGASAWSSGEVLLRTVDPELRLSSFYDPDTWANPEQAATLDDDVAVGETGTFSFQIRAPSVEAETEYLEAFALYSISADDWGAIEEPLELFITVLPGSDSGDPPDDDDPTHEEDPPVGDDDDDDDDDSDDDDLNGGGSSDSGEPGAERGGDLETADADADEAPKGCACGTSSNTGPPLAGFLGLLTVICIRRKRSSDDNVLPPNHPRTPSCRHQHSKLVSTPHSPLDSALP